MKYTMVLSATVFSLLVFGVHVAGADTLKVIADASISENADGAPTPAVSAGNGTNSSYIGIRWNPTSGSMDRNEWGIYKFDLSSIEDKSLVEGATFNAYMQRGSSNNSNRNLHLYALTPGTAGEDWPEETIEYATMPGFTFDADSTTQGLAVGPGMPLTDLGSFLTAGLDDEGSLATVTPLLEGADVLTPLINDMGSNNLLTILISYQTSSNGVWRTMTREGVTSDTGVLNGLPGDFAAFLDYEIGTGAGLPGDFNGNNSVENADLTLLLNNWAQPVPPVPDGWIGDPQPTGPAIDNDELTALLNNWGSSQGGGATSAVPEPASWTLLAMTVAALLGWRRLPELRG